MKLMVDAGPRIPPAGASGAEAPTLEQMALFGQDR